MSLVLKTAIRLHAQRASGQVEEAASRPREAQRDLLLKMLRENSETAFGRTHRFAEIKSEKDYRRRVPVRDYEEMRPFVKRIMAGERGVLTKEEPFMFTVTSGTTGEQKYIPMTCSSQRAESSVMQQWLYHALEDHPSFLSQRSVAIVARAIEGKTASGIPTGSASGLAYKNVPWLIRRTQAIPYPVFEVEDYDQRYFLIARFALGASVSFLATPNPSTLLRLAEVCSEHQEKLIRAIHDGELGLESRAGSAETFAHLKACVRPDRERACKLTRLIAEKSVLRPMDCWPGLKLIGCWIGGSVGTQARKLAPLFGDAPLRDLGYVASEGRITIPRADHTPAGMLALCSNYYEFIPEEQADFAQPRVLSSDELEAGKRYSILLTTQGGLYRYRINDIIEMTGFHKNAPLIAFVRKEGEMTNITGEKMHVNHFILAVETVRRRFNLQVEQFRATPDYTRSRYEIYLELKDTPFPERVLRERILPELDRALQGVNIEYVQKRASKRLKAPCLHLMETGWSETICRRQIAAGRRDTQYKWQILCPEQSLDDVPFIMSTIEVETREERMPAVLFVAA